MVIEWTIHFVLSGSGRKCLHFVRIKLADVNLDMTCSTCFPNVNLLSICIPRNLKFSTNSTGEPPIDKDKFRLCSTDTIYFLCGQKIMALVFFSINQ